MVPKAVAKDLGPPCLPRATRAVPLPPRRGTRPRLAVPGFLRGATLHVLLGIELCVSWLVGIFLHAERLAEVAIRFQTSRSIEVDLDGYHPSRADPFPGLHPCTGLLLPGLQAPPVLGPRGSPPRPKPAKRAPTRSAGSSAPTGSRRPLPQSPPQHQREKQRCGGGCSQGKVNCTSCSGGYVYGSRTERHMACGGTGKITCQMCGGTGYR